MYRTAEPIMRWHKAHEQYLVEPPAGGGGRRGLVAAEYRFLRARRRGRTGRRALSRLHAGADPRAHPVHPGVRRPHRRATARGLSVLVAAECRRAVRRAVRGDSALRRARRRPDRDRRDSRYTPSGATPRPDFALADLFGAHASRRPRAARPARNRAHTYLRHRGQRHAIRCCTASRRPISSPFGGTLEAAAHRSRRHRPADVHPAVPDLSARDRLDARRRRPTFRAWCCKGKVRATCPPISTAATPATICPTMPTCSPTWSAGRPADAFRSRSHGAGLVDCHLYRQPGRVDPAPRQSDQRRDVARRPSTS